VATARRLSPHCAAAGPPPDHGHDGGRRQGQARRLEVDDVVHTAALSELTHQLKRAGDEIGPHVAKACEEELIVVTNAIVLLALV
jgi:hypothetical protein